MLETLTHIPLLQDLEPDQIALLEPLFEVFTCPANTVIFEQGDPALHLYIILDGNVEIIYKPYDSAPITLTHLSRGDAFGWSAVVGSSQYTSSIISETELHAVRIRGSRLWNLCLKHPETGKIVLDRLARVVSSRWKNAHTQIQSMLDHGMARANSVQKQR